MKAKQAEWRIISETVPGASHLRAGIVNQDAILQLRESSANLPLVLAVADGHGSPKCFRSHLGSQFAVKKSVQIVSEFLDEHRENFDEIEKKGKEFLAAEFVKQWRETVEKHLEKNPFTDEEFEKLAEKTGESSRKLIEENPLLAYGTTSLTVAVEDEYILYLQLGDGDILNVSEGGEVSRAMPEDERLFANETTSLCLPNAENDFRFFVQKITAENCPALIMVSSDGYVNSFADEAGFFQAGSDFLEILGADGENSIIENLKTWLEETTATGSGDDTTVGIIFRADAVKKNLPEKIELTAKDVSMADLTKETEKSLSFSPAELQDLTLTITLKKDKNTESEPEEKAEREKSLKEKKTSVKKGL